MLAQLLLLFVLLYFVYNYVVNRNKYKLPPGPRGYPFIGNLVDVAARVDGAFAKWHQTYGEVVYFTIGSKGAVLLNSVKLIKEVFNDQTFTNRPLKMMTFLLSNGKHGVLNADGQEWQEQRRFTLRHLRDFGFGKNRMESLIMNEVNEFISGLKNLEMTPVSMKHKFEMSVLNSLWTITTGKRIGQEDTRSLEMFKKIDQRFIKPNLPGFVMILAPALNDWIPNITGYSKSVEVGRQFHEFISEIVDEHEKTLPEAENPRDFIDVYLHEVKRTADENSSFYREAGLNSLVAIVGDIFFAGSETTSTTLSWAMLYLAKEQEVQKKLQAELDNVVGKSRQVSLADRVNLPYAEATMLEIFRKSSITAAGVMHAAPRDAKILDYEIPADTWIMPNIYAIHHDPSIWGDPQNFRPERFLNEDGASVKRSENLLPFSLGKRQCIGENLARDTVFLFASNIFQRFSIRFDSSKPEPSFDPMEGFLLAPREYTLIMKDRLA